MKQVYHGSLMARRSEIPESVKGGIMLAAIIIIIITLFLASDYISMAGDQDAYYHCIEINGSIQCYTKQQSAVLFSSFS